MPSSADFDLLSDRRNLIGCFHYSETGPVRESDWVAAFCSLAPYSHHLDATETADSPNIPAAADYAVDYAESGMAGVVAAAGSCYYPEVGILVVDQDFAASLGQSIAVAVAELIRILPRCLRAHSSTRDCPWVESRRNSAPGSCSSKC